MERLKMGEIRARLKQAVEEHRHVEIDYEKPGERASTRRLKEVIFTSGRPADSASTITANDIDKDGPRTFKLDRIVDVRIGDVDPAFAPPDPGDRAA